MTAPSDAPAPDLWIETDRDGLIVAASESGLALIGYRDAARRSLLNHLVRDRPTLNQLDVAIRGHVVEHECILRPRERQGVRVHYRIELAPRSTDRWPILRWTFTRL